MRGDAPLEATRGLFMFYDDHPRIILTTSFAGHTCEDRVLDGPASMEKGSKIAQSRARITILTGPTLGALFP